MSNNNIINDLLAIAGDPRGSGLGRLLECLLNGLMQVQRQEHLGAEPYERTEDRKGYANGYKERTFHSACGPIDLRIPQVRDGDFYPGCLEKGLRSDRALKASLAEMYIQGVSTRRVSEITKALCGHEVSSTQVSRMTALLDEELKKFRERPLGAFPYVFVDARYEKVRIDGHVIDVAVLSAVGINKGGKREILGCSVSLSEAEVYWRTFLEELVRRGLHGIEMIISDDHAGLRKARIAVFPAVKWQRCQFHFAQNAQAHATTKEGREIVGVSVRRIFASPTLQGAREEVKRVIAELREKQSRFTAWLEENIEESLTCYGCPPAWLKKLRTTNGVERLNQEIKRRTRVCRLFPNEASCLRLVSAILSEIHDEWLTGRMYLKESR
jgi:transposase-like protein